LRRSSASATSTRTSATTDRPGRPNHRNIYRTQ
jgi:hypothetical protein